VRDVSGVYCWEYKVVHKPDDTTFKTVVGGSKRKKTILDVEIPEEAEVNGEITKKESSQELKTDKEQDSEKVNEENANSVGEEDDSREQENAVGEEEEDEQSEE